MRTSEPMPGVLHLLYDTRLALTLSMCRLQEYYESPIPEIRNKVFSMADFIAAHAKPDGSIDYFSYWDGFNVPKRIIDDFFALFTLTKYEHAIAHAWDLHGYKYLVATEVGSEATTLPHELAHARYELDPVYKVQVEKVVRAIPIPVNHQMRQDLSTRYANDVMEDEINAYLLTGDPLEIKDVMPNVAFDDWYPWHLQLRQL
jgi:hypothetical protein